jgi:hypothetical protein
MKLEGAPNKQVHAEDLVEALAKLHHKSRTDLPASPMSDGEIEVRRNRSGSSTTIYRPEDHGDSPMLPAIAVEDFTDEPQSLTPIENEVKPIMAHTARPPIELMEQS